MPLPNPTPVPLDERPLTVYTALAAWAVLVAGVIIAFGGFDVADPIRNGWVRLATLGVTFAALAWAFRTSSDWLAQRLQLGVAVSLVVHTIAAIGLANLALERTAAPLAEPAQPLSSDQPSTPRLALAPRIQPPTQQQSPEFQRPVTTPLVDEPLLSETLDRRTTEQQRPTIKIPDLVPVSPQPPASELATEEIRPQLTAAIARRRPDSPPAAIAEHAIGPIDTRPTDNSKPVIVFGPRAARARDALPPTQPAPISSNIQTPVESVASEETVSPAETLATPAIARASAPRRDTVSRPPSPRVPGVPLVPAVPLELESRPKHNSVQPPAAVASPRPRPEARPARSAVESLVTIAAPAASSLQDSPLGTAAPRQPDLNHQQRTPPSGDRPAVASLGRGPRRVASLFDKPLGAGNSTGNPLPVTRLPTPTDDLPPTIAPPTTSNLQPRIAAGIRRLKLAPRPPGLASELALSGQIKSFANQDLAADLAAGPGASDATGASRPPSTAVLPRIASAARPARSRDTLLGAGPVLPRLPAPAFADRQKRQQQRQPTDQASATGPPPRTEKAIEIGLKYLAGTQRANGSWSFQAADNQADGQQPTARADGAATGLALLSLLGAGCDHYDPAHGDAVRRGLDYLLANQRDDGLLFPELGKRPDTAATGSDVWAVARFYSHGIAAIALCEAYGMTGDAKLREPAQRSLDYIAQSQTASRGGWRYLAGVDADLSVTGWQLMALRSGELAGLQVAPQTYDRVRKFVESCRERSGNRVRFRYNPLAPKDNPRASHGRRPGTVMTAVGLLSMLYLGDDPRAARMQLGAGHLRENLPTDQALPGGPPRARISTISNPLRDTYYWYYATQVMFHMGGEYWRTWNEALHPLLVNSQQQQGELAGSWNPYRPLPDRWSQFGGRHYVTTMNLLSLEVYYRHLPLYGRVSE